MLALIIVGVIAVGLAVAVVLLAGHVERVKARMDEAGAALRDASADNAACRARIHELSGFLEHHEKEVAWCKQELQQRPKITRRTYKVLTVGVSGTGKTALTLKWANPLVDLGTLQGTKIERYERMVSRVLDRDMMIEHVFEIGDWGGEHLVEAQHELIMEEVHGLLMVVDLARKGTSTLDPERIQEQLREFEPQALRFFFGPRMSASCQTVVLFINKSDVLVGTPAEVEREATSYYAPLIDTLQKSGLDVRVLVGSAQYGHSTHELFAHFVERISCGVTVQGPYVHALMKAGVGDAAADAARIPHEAKLPAFPGGGFLPFEVPVHELEETGAVTGKNGVIVCG